MRTVVRVLRGARATEHCGLALCFQSLTTGTAPGLHRHQP